MMKSHGEMIKEMVARIRRAVEEVVLLNLDPDKGKSSSFTAGEVLEAVRKVQPKVDLPGIWDEIQDWAKIGGWIIEGPGSDWYPSSVITCTVKPSVAESLLQMAEEHLRADDDFMVLRRGQAGTLAITVNKRPGPEVEDTTVSKRAAIVKEDAE